MSSHSVKRNIKSFSTGVVRSLDMYGAGVVHRPRNAPADRDAAGIAKDTAKIADDMKVALKKLLELTR